MALATPLPLADFPEAVKYFLQSSSVLFCGPTEALSHIV
ncbi:hypothetical protein T08_12016 [Trichinella sp. T8]|nr:hypothetical protein T08_12016 [Trichinella sp. T8]